MFYPRHTGTVRSNPFYVTWPQINNTKPNHAHGNKRIHDLKKHSLENPHQRRVRIPASKCTVAGMSK
jgi:hypothetical protein